MSTNTLSSVFGGSLGGNIDVGGSMEIGSGDVALVGTDGKINGPLSTTIIDNLSGANLTTLNASNVSSGTLANARLPTNVDLGGTLDVTGATTLDSTLGVVGDVVFNDAGADKDFRVETSGNANMVVVDGALNGISFGIAPSDYWRYAFAGAFTSGGASTSCYGFWHASELTGHSGDSSGISGMRLDISTKPTGTSALIAQLNVNEPTIDNAAAVTITNSASIYIQGAASEATNNYALFVDAGNSRFDGSVGVGGNTSFDGTLHVETGSAGSISFQAASDDLIVEHSNHAGITVATPADKEGSLMFLGPTTTDLGIIAYNQGTPGFQFHVANAKKATITAHGLCFGTDTADANALDDYEEGTFTPVLTGTTSASGVGYDTQSGIYTKIGDMVYIDIFIDLNDKGTIVGFLKITGLPFTNAGHAAPLTVSAQQVATISPRQVTGPVYGSSAFMYLFLQKQSVATSDVQMDTNDINDSSILNFSGSYKV